MKPRNKEIPVSRPWLGDAEARAAARAIASQWVTQGPEVEAFEKEFASAVGAAHACAMASCTTALHAALVASGVGPGDEVVTVSHSFIATANSIRHCGATPVFVDIDPVTFNLVPALVEKAIGPRTRAILCVHQLGLPCDVPALAEIARRRNLTLIEDAACAIGSEIRVGKEWQRIGKPHGHLACFSFHPRKLLTTGDGGMVTTSDAGLDAKLRLLRQHGMSLNDRARHEAKGIVFERYEMLGFNYRMNDIEAAIGRAQLERLPEVLRVRRAQAERYAHFLQGIPGLVLPSEPAWARANWQSYCVRLPAGSDQKQVMQALRDEGIATRRGVMCAHREPAYPKGSHRVAPGGLAESERAQDECLILPLFHTLTAVEQGRVAQALRRACRATPKLRKAG